MIHAPQRRSSAPSTTAARAASRSARSVAWACALGALAAVVATTSPATADPGEPQPPIDPPGDLEEAPWDPLYVEACKERLATAGYTEGYRFTTRHEPKERRFRRYDPQYCYAPQATLWTRGPTGVRYYGHSMFNCAMALAMTRFEQIVQEEARRIFPEKPDRPVRAIKHLGTHTCRPLRAKPGVQSQHSFGNAIDVEAFWIGGYGKVTIERHWEPSYPAQRRGSEFLHALVERLREEEVFTNVLDPTWDAFHNNHLHLDLAVLSDDEPSPALARTLAMPAERPSDGGAAPDGGAASGERAQPAAREH